MLVGKSTPRNAKRKRLAVVDKVEEDASSDEEDEEEEESDNDDEDEDGSFSEVCCHC